MPNGNSFVLDRLDAAFNKVDGFENISGPPRRQAVREAIVQLRHEVEAKSVTPPSLELDAIAHCLSGLSSGRALAKAVGARELDGFAKYENEDPGWIKCLLEYASSHPVDFPIAPPGAAINPLQNEGEIKI